MVAMTDKSDQQQQADKAAQQEAEKAAKEQQAQQQQGKQSEDIDKGFAPGEYPDEGTFGYADKSMSEAQAEVMPEQQSKEK
jgi:hypothetical protein